MLNPLRKKPLKGFFLIEWIEHISNTIINYFENIINIIINYVYKKGKGVAD